MKTNKQYGYTTPKCWNCGNHATKFNKSDLPCCIKCLNVESITRCLVCKGIMESRKGKYGSYFHCIPCNINFSLNKIKKIKK